MPLNEAENNSDIVLVQRTIAGDREAFSGLVTRYKNGLLNTIYRILGNAGDAEDIAQDTFLRAYNNLKTYQVGYQFSTWIYNIAINLSRNKLKQRKFTFFSIHKSDDHEETEQMTIELTDNSADPDKQLLQQENKQLVQKMLNFLKPQQREIFVLRYFENFSYDEIANVTGLPLGTVKTFIHRARELLYKNFKSTETFL